MGIVAVDTRKEDLWTQPDHPHPNVHTLGGIDETFVLDARELCWCCSSDGAASAQLVFWTTEVQPERMAKQQQIVAAYQAATGTSVQLVPIEESDLGPRVTAAFAAGELPDVILTPLSQTIGWADAGIFDTAAANEVVDTLGRATFAPGALDLVPTRATRPLVPISGWTQLIVYRKDLFDATGLQPPTTFAAITTAVDTLGDPPDMFGFVAATDPNNDYMMQVLEEFFLADGVTPHRARRQGQPRQGQDRRGPELLQEARRREPRGQPLLAAVARALPRRPRRHGGVVAVHPRRARRPARLRARHGLRRPDQPAARREHRLRDPPLRSEQPWRCGLGQRHLPGHHGRRRHGQGRSSSSSTCSPTATSTGCRSRPRGSSRFGAARVPSPPCSSTAGRKLPVGVDRKAPLSQFYAPGVITHRRGPRYRQPLGLLQGPGRHSSAASTAPA